MSQGVISLLLEYGRRLSAQWLDGGPLRLAFDDVDAAESTEQELLALLVRRADPASLHVVIGSAADRLPRLLCLLGRIEQERGALDEARAALDRALLADPACAPALVDRATLAYSREDLSAAAADLTAALELLGDDPDVLYNRGVVYQEWGRFSDAVEDFDRAMTDAGADTAELLSRRAECLAALVGPAGGRVGVA
jgi:tetratricopeptide (TPR) repeat protein